MKRIYYICNLQAGKAEIGSHLGTVLDMMTKAGYEVTVHPTQSPLDATYSAAAAADSGLYDLIFCSGGDGTLNEVLCGMFRAKNDLPIGYIPCGSVNDFARSIGIPREIPRACAAALDGYPRRFDIGMANDRCFNYIAAFGAFTDVTYETPQAAKNVLGPAAYILNAMTKINSIQAFPMRITCDGTVIEDEFAFGMVTNSASVGGVLDISDFCFDDGTFEITLLKRPMNPSELHRTLSFLRDIHEIRDDDMIYCLRASEVTIELADGVNMPWTVDGEYLQNARIMRIVNHKRAVQLLVPEDGPTHCYETSQKE
ncbi:MAG: diacylglycerol kinase family lipid kinase [Oscillospiraceae bacterium]|nr:diacylglycerol kinase family lipid kinase [Oscillospiraceae bacterium]